MNHCRQVRQMKDIKNADDLFIVPAFENTDETSFSTPISSQVHGQMDDHVKTGVSNPQTPLYSVVEKLYDKAQRKVQSEVFVY